METLHEPRSSEVLRNVHHMNMFPHIERQLTAWIIAQFGVPDLAGFAQAGSRC